VPDPTNEADIAKHRVWLGNGTATFIIAVMVIVLFAGYIFAVTFFPPVGTLGKEQQGAILGVLITNFGYAVGYYIASSIGSENKSVELAGKR
jgi:hypothetical protein